MHSTQRCKYKPCGERMFDLYCSHFFHYSTKFNWIAATSCSDDRILNPYSPINQDASAHHDKIPLHNMLNFGDEKINKMGDKYAHKMQQ